jgi:Putative prokaryotic signal transducing protein
MAQGPDEREGGQGSAKANLSHDLDMVSLFQSQTVDAELDAENIRGVLESGGIASVLETSPVASLGFEVFVARADLERAQALISEALDAGPEAADEAEAESEKPQ